MFTTTRSRGSPFSPRKAVQRLHMGSPKGGKMEIRLFRYWEDSRRLLTFVGCVNVDLRIDATILAHNTPNSTSHAEASADVAAIRRVILGHRSVWNCFWLPGRSSPLRPKLAEADKWVLFRLQMFGGLTE